MTRKEARPMRGAMRRVVVAVAGDTEEPNPLVPCRHGSGRTGGESVT